MKIYSNLDLIGNTVSDLTANHLIIGQQNNKTTNGAIKWVNGSNTNGNVTPGHFEYYDSNAETPGWTILSTGSNTTTIQYTADGIFKIAKGANATTTGTWPQSIHVDSDPTGNNATSITLNTTNSGDITVATSNTGSPKLTLPIASNIISSVIKTGTFTIDNTISGTIPYNITINHGLETRFLDFSLYKKADGSDGSKDVWTSIMCDYHIDPSSPYNLHLYLTSSNVSNIYGDYIFVVIGSAKASALTASNITITGTSI
jgi:hypothetical protein